MELRPAFKDSEILSQLLKKEITIGVSFHSETANLIISLCRYCKGYVVALETTFMQSNGLTCMHAYYIYTLSVK